MLAASKTVEYEHGACAVVVVAEGLSYLSSLAQTGMGSK